MGVRAPDHSVVIGLRQRRTAPLTSEEKKVIFALLAFAAGFIVRPFGAIFFGRLGDLIGRKPIVLAGMLLAVLTYFPLFEALTNAANPKLAAAQKSAQVSVTASAGDCSFQGNPVAREIDFTKSCDIAKRFLPRTR